MSPYSNAIVLENALDKIAGSRQALHDAVGRALQIAIAYVCDGSKFESLEGVVKTMIGTKVEKLLLDSLGLITKAPGATHKLDTVISGIDVDVKFTCRRTWTIPREAHDEWCWLLRADCESGTFDYGLIFVTADVLTWGLNRDKKLSISADGMKQITWLGQGLRLPDAIPFCPETAFAKIATTMEATFESSPEFDFGDLAAIPKKTGIYALKMAGNLTYVGKAVASGGLRERLKQHQLKLAQASKIDMAQMSFKFMECSKPLATGLEEHLIASWGSPWNGSGFGSKVAGAGRTNQKRADWDIQYDRREA